MAKNPPKSDETLIQRQTLMAAFYEEVLQIKPMVSNARFCAFDVSGESVLLLFREGASLRDEVTEGGTIPAHDGSGPTHMAFAISKEDLPAWEKRLTEHDVSMISRVQWPLGGTSLYFHDPEEHVIELATPGVWPIY